MSNQEKTKKEREQRIASLIEQMQDLARGRSLWETIEELGSNSEVYRLIQCMSSLSAQRRISRFVALLYEFIPDHDDVLKILASYSLIVGLEKEGESLDLTGRRLRYMGYEPDDKSDKATKAADKLRKQQRKIIESFAFKAVKIPTGDYDKDEIGRVLSEAPAIPDLPDMESLRVRAEPSEGSQTEAPPRIWQIPRFHALTEKFVNREAEIKLFTDILESGVPYNQNVIMYYGIGGIGKSSLSAVLKAHTDKQDILFASVCFEDRRLHTPFEALNTLACGLGVPLPHFDTAVTLYHFKSNPENAYSEFGHPSEIAAKAASIIRESGTFSPFRITLGLTAKLYNKLGCDYGLDVSKRMELMELEALSAPDIEEALSGFFADDLRDYLDSKEQGTCVLFFDTYELLWDNGQKEGNKLKNDAWIRTIAERLDNSILVVSGRDRLLWGLESGHWNDKAVHCHIQELEAEHAMHYLKQCGVGNAGDRQGIWDTTGGFPFYLDLCIDIYDKSMEQGISIEPESFKGGQQKLVELFFRNLSSEETLMLRTLSVPRIYDYELFKALNRHTQTGYAAIDFGNFNSYSFVRQEAGGRYVIHGIMREAVVKSIPAEFAHDINVFLAGYYKEKLYDEDMPVDGVRYCFSELLYHLNALGSKQEMLDCIETEHIGSIKKLQRAGETEYLLAQLNGLFYGHYYDPGKKRPLGNGEFFAVMTDMIHLSGRNSEASAMISEYLGNFSMEQIVGSPRLIHLYIRKVHYELSVKPLKEAYLSYLELYDALGDHKDDEDFCEVAYVIGSRFHLPMGNYDEALSHFHAAQRRSRNSPDIRCRIMRKRSEHLMATGELRDAERICLMALKKAGELSFWREELYARCILGEIMRVTGRTKEAEAMFKEALHTATSMGIPFARGNMLFSIGNCYADMGDAESAREYHSRAYDVYERHEEVWGMVSVSIAFCIEYMKAKREKPLPKLLHVKAQAAEYNYDTLVRKIDSLLDCDIEAYDFDALYPNQF